MRSHVVFALLLVSLPACAHHIPMTVITTRQNGTIKLCGDVKQGEKMVVGESPEGSRVSVNASDIVTMEQNGTCKK